MQKIRTVPLPWPKLHVDPTTEVAILASAWIPAQELYKFRGNYEILDPTGGVTVALGYQTANVENAPDAHVVDTTFQTAAGVSFGSSVTEEEGSGWEPSQR